MREILFRGAQKVDGSKSLYWHEGSLVIEKDTYTDDIEYYIQNENGSFLVVPETVGQYTGLVDKNGKKIFEGDIIAHFINWFGKRFNGAVRYESKIACWVCDFVVNNKTESAYLADWVCGNGAEVIGNSHDNPELVGISDKLEES